MNVLRKYLRLYWSFFRASFIADLEYRANFASRIVTDIFWYLAQIITFEGIFLHTPDLGGWTAPQMRVFLGVLFVVDAIYMVLFYENLDRMTERVRKGELDIFLAKPVNSQFMVSLQRANTAILGNLLIASLWLGWSLSQIPDFNPLKLFWLMMLVPCGVLAIYATRFAFVATSVIFTRSDSLQFLWFQIYKLGMRPDSIYVPWFRVLMLSVIPFGIVASVPTRSLLFEPDYNLYAWVVLWSFVLLYASNKFWNYCLRQYSSASS